MAEQFIPRLSSWLSASVEKHEGGDRVTYDVFALNNPDGFAVFFLLSVPSMVLGEHMSAMIAVPFANAIALTEDAIDNLVFEGLKNLREQRSQLPTQQQTVDVKDLAQKAIAAQQSVHTPR